MVNEPPSRITQAGAIMDEAASEPREDRKRDLFGKAWLVARPQLLALTRRSVRDDDLVDDTMSYTAQKLWRAVQTGYQPQHGYEAILPGTPSRAASTILLRTQKHRDNPATSLSNPAREGDTLDDYLHIEHDAEPDRFDAQPLRERLDRASQRARRLGDELAARVLHHGMQDTVAITAQRLESSSREVAAAIDWIRDNQYALLTASDTRFDEYEVDVMGGTQMDLMSEGDAA